MSISQITNSKGQIQYNDDYTEQPIIKHCPYCDLYKDEHANEININHVFISEDELCSDCKAQQEEETYNEYIKKIRIPKFIIIKL